MRSYTKGLMLIILAGGALAVQAQPGEGIMRLDADGDGLISRTEFQPPASHRGPRMLEKADTDGDGSVTRDEMLAAIDDAAEEQRARMSGHMLLMFEEADADGNGILTREEATGHAFARVDANSDGYISADEAQQMRRQREARHERRGPGN